MAMNYNFPIFPWSTSYATPALNSSPSFNPDLTEEAERLGDNPNPYVNLGNTGYGGYGSVQPGEWDLLYSDFQTQLLAYNNLYNKAIKNPWWLSKRAQKDRLGALEAEGNRLNQTYDKLNGMVTELGLEGTVPPLEDYSKETMSLVLETAGKQAAENKASSLKTVLKTAEYAGLAFDAARSILNDNRDVYDGAKGHIASTMDAAGDSISNSLMASGNPWAMAAGAAYKGMSMLNQVIGHSTDGMTTTDSVLDSNLGFALTGGLSKLNAKFGTTTDKFKVDEDLHSAMGSSYIDTYGDLDDAESKAGKRYGFLSKKSARKAQNEIHMADLRLNIISDINETAQDRVSAGNYEGIGFRNLMNLNGGFRAMRAARKGIKMNLDFAHKVAKALEGFRFNIFNMLEYPSITPDATKAPDLVPPILDIETSLNPLKSVTELDFKELGVIFKGVDNLGRLVYEAPWGLGDLLGKNLRLIDNLIKKYGANGVVFNSVRLEDTTSQSNPPQQNNLGSTQGNTLPDLSGLQNNNSGPSAEELDSAWKADLEAQKKNEMMETLDSLLGNYEGTRDQVIDLAIKMILNHFPDLPLEEAYAAAENWYEHHHKNGKHNNQLNAGQQGNGEYTPIEADSGTPIRRNGGTFTFTPYTDEQVNKFKAGGSFNVIPDGALHKNRHNMEDAEGLTKKGIPVVTEEDGKKVQLAEIEVNEIIFRLEVTEKLEKLAKQGTDEAAVEAGKLITEEILHNTHDNTGLIKLTV